jgi:hypothetical protein
MRSLLWELRLLLGAVFAAKISGITAYKGSRASEEKE